MHHRYVKFRGTVGKAAIVRASVFGDIHKPHHFRQERIPGFRRGADDERRGKVQRAGTDIRAGADGHGVAFARCDGTIKFRAAFLHLGIDGYAFACRENDAHAGADFIDRQIVALVVFANHHRAAAAKLCEAPHGGTGAGAHHVVECAADQQEEEKRYGSVEIGVLAVMDGFIDAHGEGE